MAPQNPLKRKRGGASSRSKDARGHKRQSEDQEIRDLDTATAEFVASDDTKLFEQLPLSTRTQKGLKKAYFTEMTDIQTRTLPLSLRGCDVLGAARTGSGKTLAFLIPVLEMLYRKKWGPADGLGALIISPTRELAIQIFEVLRKIGPFHTFSAGLVIGGKDLKQEKDRLARMNILVATPGRLLQHMDETIGFECSNLQLLVLDEADRILDMGFAKTVNAIIENVPRSRQTMLFSATQTKRVKDLARLSLQSPEYVAVREADFEGSTPRNLEQHYMVVPLEHKLDVLYSFLRTHTSCKALVFMSSCRQVQFVHETFCKLRPGISLLALHGKQKQTKRLQIFSQFTSSQHAILFATDIAARGLDFPAVDWVVQLDAPEDVDTYIHRVGRTARYQAKGQSLLFLLPSEEKGVLENLAKKNVPVGKIKPRESKTQSIQNQLQSFAFQEPEVKHLAQKAFVSYVRSIFLQKDKATFNVTELPLDKFAAALGLAGAPKIKFVKEAVKAQKKKAGVKKAEEAAQANGTEAVLDDEDKEQTSGKDGAVRTKYDRMFERKNQTLLSEHYAKLIHEDDDESGESGSGSDDDAEDGEAPEQPLVGGDDPDADDGDFITLKRANHALDGDDEETPTDFATAKAEAAAQLSKRKLEMGKSKKAMSKYRAQGEKVVFDDEGAPHALYELQDEADFRAAGAQDDQARAFVEAERERLRAADVDDKELAKQKRREKKLRKKLRERDEDGDSDDDDGEGGAPVLAPIDDREDGYETPDFELPSGSEDEDSEDEEPQNKRSKQDAGKGQPSALETDEELALRLLNRRR